MIQGLLRCALCGISHKLVEAHEGVELNFNLPAIFEGNTMPPCANCHQLNWIIQITEKQAPANLTNLRDRLANLALDLLRNTPDSELPPEHLELKRLADNPKGE